MTYEAQIKFLKTSNLFLIIIIQRFMAYAELIQKLDRLTVKSVLRGSTSTILGILGTLTLFVLCLALYIPPTVKYFQGNYFQSQFWIRDLVNQKFYSNDDFKIAIQLRKRSDNSVANHTQILSWAYSEFAQLYADQSEAYIQPSATCYPKYFADAINPVTLEDCFIFPQHKLFDVFADYGVYTAYTNIFYWLYPKKDLNPFYSQLSGNRERMTKLLTDYYYVVYFTSKITDPRTGKQSFQVNRYYSTDSDYSENVGSTIDIMIYNVKNYTLDISIMPWINNITTNGLMWLGQALKIYQLTLEQTSNYGIEFDFSLYHYSVVSYRYYKKLDWLLGIIGGAMLLFYIILWVPCNFINKTIHQMNNVNQLLLINHANEEEPITEDKVTAANVTTVYWFNNFITRKLFSSVQNADKLVQAGQKELDIVRLVKKIKVTERSLLKKKILVPYQPKILKLKTVKIGNQNEQEAESGMQEDNQSQQIVQTQRIVQDDVVELPIEPTFGILQRQMNLLKEDQTLKNVYENNMTANIIRGDADHTMRLKQMQFKNKMGAIYPSKRKISRAKIVWNALVDLVKYFDLFGARPNLIAPKYSSSLVGLCGVMLIFLCSILVCALTLKNANVPQFMILDRYQDQNDFGYSLTTGSSLKFALCFDRASSLIGTNKIANLQFFSNSKIRGFQYIQAVKLTSADYAKFDLTSSTTPVNINYCFGLDPGHEVLMGQNGTNFGYFGFKVEPYCSSTAAYCNSNAASINNNFLSFINKTLVYLFLPQNRFDPITKTFKNRLAYQRLNINLRYMKNTSAFEETLFVDQVRIEDDTKNWFMRKQPEVNSQSIAQNQYTSYPLSRNIPGSPYYSVNIKPSGNQIRYLISTKKADTILAILGGVFVFFYAIFHWIGKLYNTFKVKAKLAEVIYDQQSINESPLIKLLAISPIPTCMIPARFGFKYDVARVRQVQKKMNYDLNYLWLVKYVDNIFNLSAALFEPPFARMQAKNLSLVYVKEKIDQSEQATNRVFGQQSRHIQQEFNEEIEIGREMQEKGNFYDKKKKHNKVLNESSVINVSDTNLQESLPDQKIIATSNVLDLRQCFIQQTIQENHLHGNPKQPRFNMLDTFQYSSSLTLNGQREVTSFCGGCCCLIMTMLIILVANFQANIYLNRSDMRVGMSTEVMQPLSTQSNSTFNSKLSFNTGKDFKLAITFSSNYEDYPHNVSNWTSIVGISVFQQTFTRSEGKIITSTVEYPFKPCSSDYLKPTDPMIDPEYYKNTQYGYCVPDGISLQISGLPQDQVNKRFTLSIFNKVGTKAANQQLKIFMQNYLPKIHFSSPTLDFTSKKLKYDIQSFTFDSFNLTYPVSQNISFAKMNVLFDDQIAFEGDPYEANTYVAMPFQQFQTYYVDTVSTMMSYNFSFANSHTVYRYTVVGDKFYQTFGIIGGLVALFIFALGIFPRGFNQYRMQYLIGKQLYLFDILKKKQAMALARGRKRKSKEQIQSLSDYNDINEAKLLLAYTISFFAMIISDYNINTTLRRVTLIQQRIIKDINLFEVYKKIHNIRDALNKHFRSDSVKLTNIHLKHIYNPDPDSQSLVEPAKIVSFAKKHCWSTFEQYAVFDALKGRVNLKEVFDNGFLQKAFNMEGLDRNSIHLSQFGGTQGSIGTTSIVESIAQPSQMPKQETFDLE